MTAISVTATGFETTQLLGDPGRGIAVLVDPPANPDPWLLEAARQDLRIRHVILTGQVDPNLLGYRVVTLETGAQLYLGGPLECDLPALRLFPGDVLEFGCLRITIEHAGARAVQLCLTCTNKPVKECASVFTNDAPR